MTLSEQIKKVETEEKDNTEKIAECLKLLEDTKDNLPEKPTQDDLFNIWQGFLQARNSLIKMRAFGTEEMSKYYDMLDEVRDWLHYSEAFEELKIIIKSDAEPGFRWGRQEGDRFYFVSDINHSINGDTVLRGIATSNSYSILPEAVCERLDSLILKAYLKNDGSLNRLYRNPETQKLVIEPVTLEETERRDQKKGILYNFGKGTHGNFVRLAKVLKEDPDLNEIEKYSTFFNLTNYKPIIFELDVFNPDLLIDQIIAHESFDISTPELVKKDLKDFRFYKRVGQDHRLKLLDYNYHLLKNIHDSETANIHVFDKVKPVQDLTNVRKLVNYNEEPNILALKYCAISDELNKKTVFKFLLNDMFDDLDAVGDELSKIGEKLNHEERQDFLNCCIYPFEDIFVKMEERGIEYLDRGRNYLLDVIKEFDEDFNPEHHVNVIYDKPFNFDFEALKESYSEISEACLEELYDKHKDLEGKLCVNDKEVDISVAEAMEICDKFDEFSRNLEQDEKTKLNNLKANLLSEVICHSSLDLFDEEFKTNEKDIIKHLSDSDCKNSLNALNYIAEIGPSFDIRFDAISALIEIESQHNR